MNTMKSSIQSQMSARAEVIRRLVPLLIALITLLTFFPALQNGFVDWDDNRNFVNNPHYRGLGWTELRWMFTTLHMGHYQPLSWMTFGLDYLLWGMNPFGYHLSNLFLHAANAVLFYFVAFRLLSLALSSPAMPKEPGLRVAAGFAALIFAIHPLRVESVAWVTERRDVLSGLFILWTILCYLRAATCPSTDSSRGRWMAGAVIVYCLSLLAKASGVTLPIVLLVLDVYPLGRLGGGPGKWFGPEVRRIWWEKMPFLILAMVAGVIAPIAQFQVGSLPPLERYGVVFRVAEAFFGLAFYLWKTIIPLALSPLYEVPFHFNPWDWPFVLSGVVVFVITLSLFILRRRWPAGLAIWVSYVVILAPVLGIFQNGPQLVADRYSYLSCLGWAVLAGAGVVYFWEYWDSGKLSQGSFASATALAAVILVLLGVTTWRQTQVWHDSERLFRHIIAVTDGSRFQSSNAHNNLGIVLFGRGDFAEAIEHYRIALQINPLDEKAHDNLGSALASRGDLAGAIEQHRLALQINPLYDKAHNNLAAALANQGDLAGAIEQFRLALQINPLNEKAHNNLGTALAKQGDLAGAIEQFRLTLQINPLNEKAHNGLGKALASRGELGEAIEHYQQAINIQPAYASALENLRLALEQREKTK